VLQRPLQQWEQVRVDQHRPVTGVADDEGQVLGRQAQVEGVEHPTGAGDGEVRLEVTGAVPGQGAHGGVTVQPEVVEACIELAGPGPETRRRCAARPRRQVSD